MAVYLPLLVALIGVILWGFSTNGKLMEAGRIMFFCGLLAFLLTGPGQMVSLLS
jgi:hypothetical protein